MRSALPSFSLAVLITAMNHPALAAIAPVNPAELQTTASDLIYTTRQGDTLMDISQQFTGTTRNWSAIGERNKISNDRTIPIGTLIRIPLTLLPDEESEAKIVAMAGSPVIRPPKGNDTAATIGTILKEGTEIRTGKSGFMTLALPDESRISIPSNSAVALSKLRKTRFTSSPRTEVSVLEGKVESRVTSLVSNKGRFEVRSPLAVAGVRGTHFRVGVTDGGTASEVLEGGVAVGMAATKKSPQTLVGAGKGNLTTGKGVGSPVDLLPPPLADAASQLQIRPTMVFNVQPVKGAVAYRAQIARDAEALDILQEAQFTQARFKFDGLDDGRYFLRTTAIDAQGLEGKPSVTAFTLKARPEPPFTSEPKNKVRAAQVKFAWTEATQASAYRIQVATDPDFHQPLIDQSDLRDTQFSTDQLGDQRYYWRVASIAQKNGTADQGPFSDAQAFVKMPLQPGASFRDSEGKDITINWQSEPGQRFLIQIATTPDFSSLYLSRELSEAELKLPRPPSGDYFIRVRATDADGYVGAFSAAQKIRIEARWADSSGEAIRSSDGVIRTGF
jgi:hypothetical protein